MILPNQCAHYEPSGDALAVKVADIRTRLAVTDNSADANTLDAGSGLDWFWATYAKVSLNRKPTDLLN